MSIVLSTKPLKMQLKLHSSDTTIDTLHSAPQKSIIDFLAVKGTFDNPLIEHLSQRFNIPKNMMFIGTPGDRFPYRIEDLGCVRVILG
jgi:hypothetical protein